MEQQFDGNVRFNAESNWWEAFIPSENPQNHGYGNTKCTEPVVHILFCFLKRRSIYISGDTAMQVCLCVGRELRF